MEKPSRTIVFTVLVGALGYFVDIYDLLIFGIVRMPSLRALGVPENQMLDVGVHIFNMQMAGMLLGGIIWGILGDKRGRKSVMFGSILLYSLCNLANAFVPDPTTYGWLRFFAGIGLAGELGAAVTLVAEVMPQKSRGFGTAIVAAVGVLGAVFAAIVGDIFDWKVAYLVGGGMGIGLLLLRAGLAESGMFQATRKSNASRGKFLKLFTDRDLFGRYLCCILIGVPVWYVIGVLITFAPELARELGVTGTVTGANAIMWSYAGLSLGDLGAGLLSQFLKSRKKTVLAYLLACLVLTVLYRFLPAVGVGEFYFLCACLGAATGYWATFTTIAAEQFGTNIRATVATTVPNFVRGSVVPVTLSFKYLRPEIGLLNSALTLGLICLAIAFVALYFLQETFTKELNYLEKH